EGRGEGRGAARGAVQTPPAAGGTAVRQLVLEVLEPASGGTAVEAECAPVPEHVSPLFAQPVNRLAHGRTVVPARARAARGSLACGRLSPSNARMVQWRLRA